MKRNWYCRLLLPLFCLFSGCAAAGAAIRAADLRTEWLVNPQGVDAIAPRLSWRVESTARGARQTAFQICVATSAVKLDKPDLWDSGRIVTNETLNIVYGGKPLISSQRLFWRVRLWDADGNPSKWSEPAQWTMGLLSAEDWKAQWISFRDVSPVHASRKDLQLPPARHYRKSFAARKRVQRATLHASALGIAEFHLNGKRVSDSFFEPGWSDYRKRAYYRTHDVTKLLQGGNNCIGAILADGWYAGYVGYGVLVGYGPNKSGRNFYGKTPALLAQLEIEYADGSRETVITDSSWQVSGDGPIREADLIMGESFDARRDNPGWCVPGADIPWKWEPAIRAEENGSIKATYHDTLGAREVELGFRRPPVLQSYAAQPIRVTEELKARRITEPKPGVYIFDLGQNFAGTVRLKVKASAGTRLQLRYGEMLHSDGRLMTENLRRARATDYYTCRGGKAEEWIPRFTYHGFQFVEVTGLNEKPDEGMITGLVLHNDTPIVGSFACSDEVMTRFGQNALWTQRANFVELPTDCPQRDERLGWMGDAQVYARTASCFADVAAFFTKWIVDVREAQREFGAYPDYCPYPMAHGSPGATHGTAWTDAGVIVPYTIWQVYADQRLIEQHWDSMTRFMDWRAKSDPELRGVKIGNTWGDWLNLGEETPIEYVDLCYYGLDAALMGEMADALGKPGEAERYRTLRRRIAESFSKHCLIETNGCRVPKVNTQTADVLALWIGLLPDERSAHETAARLAGKIAARGERMATGFLGTKPLLGVLTANGHHDLAVRLFQSRRFPSWGYEVVNGATTVWERWDSYTREHGFNGASGNQNASMNSFSHYSFGAVMEWAFRNLAGIDTDGPGFKRVLIRPRPPGQAGGNPAPIHWVKAEYVSPRGSIRSAWKRDGDRFDLNVAVPANTTATVFLPVVPGAEIIESGKLLAKQRGIKSVRNEPNLAVIEVESGNYEFRSQPGAYRDRSR